MIWKKGVMNGMNATWLRWHLSITKSCAKRSNHTWLIFLALFLTIYAPLQQQLSYHVCQAMIVLNTSVLHKDLTILWSLDLHLLHQLQSGHLCWRSLLIQILFCYRYTHRSEIVLRASKSLRPFKSSPPSCRLSFPVFVFALPSQSALLCFAYFACRC